MSEHDQTERFCVPDTDRIEKESVIDMHMAYINNLKQEYERKCVENRRLRQRIETERNRPVERVGLYLMVIVSLALDAHQSYLVQNFANALRELANVFG